MEFTKKVERLLVKNTICCFTLKNEEEFIASVGVIKLKTNSRSDSPKKKKKIQNVNKR
jgi:hypothetical protein